MPDCLPHLIKQADRSSRSLYFLLFARGGWLPGLINGLGNYRHSHLRSFQEQISEDCVTRLVTLSGNATRLGCFWHEGMCESLSTRNEMTGVHNCLLLWKYIMHEMPEEYKRVFLFSALLCINFIGVSYFQKEKKSFIYHSLPDCT